jgi:HEPN domain-containing protein
MQSIATQAAQWLGWADEDYLAARSLLLRGFVLQGTILANTALEKYLKTALIIHGVRFRNTHDVLALYDLLRTQVKLPPLLPSFLTLLGKAYKMRYPDDLPPGFNIALAGAKVLSEVDWSVYELRKGFGFARTSGDAAITKLDELIRTQGSALVERNVAFGKTSRAELFSTSTVCFDFRVLDNGDILEANYLAGPIQDDRDFTVEGLKPGSSGTP